ncbi:phage major capsid protein [Paraburkholderia sp. J11-2]|uniref:phage major capsid protein n=1 Tax=Paraburkholderia sp. J11-2 TaxID=2805431 RepID=UPI002AB75700|nr:phage major capsid protein [Paraburkholderia sp. J11-2]
MDLEQLKEVTRKALEERDAKLEERFRAIEINAIDLGQKIGGRDEGGTRSALRGGSLAELITKSELIDAFRRNGQSAQMTLEAGSLVKAVAPMVSTLGDAANGLPVPPALRIAAALQLPTFWRALQSTPLGSTNAVEVIEYALTTGAAVQVEGQSKVVAGNTPTVRTCPIPTVAIVKKCSEQLLDDVGQLQQFLDSELSSAVDVAIDNEVLHGDGSTGHGLGLDSTATAFAPTADGANMLDALLQAIGQLMAAGGSQIVVGINPMDAVTLATLKASGSGEYLLDPLNPQKALWGAALAASPAVAAGTFYAAASPLGAWIASRNDIVVRMALAEDDFIKNLVSFRAEARVGPVTEHVALVLKGVYTTPPVSATKTKP